MQAATKLFPSEFDYNMAVTDLAQFAREPRLRKAVPVRTRVGNRLLSYSGGFSRVYAVQYEGRRYALRCWHSDVDSASWRYTCIGEHLKADPLSSFVEFEFLDDALIVNDSTVPVLWMEWAEGERLRTFLDEHHGNRDTVRTLAESFRQIVGELHRRKMAHGDLSDENLLVEMGSGTPRLRLIDYDSVFVPALRERPSKIIGLPNYQHPRRGTLAHPCEAADYFSELVIYLSLSALTYDSSLWKPGLDKQLLLTDRDFRDPDQSELLQRIRGLSDEIGGMVDELVEFCRVDDLSRLRPLEDVLGPEPVDLDDPFKDFLHLPVARPPRARADEAARPAAPEAKPEGFRLDIGTIEIKPKPAVQTPVAPPPVMPPPAPVHTEIPPAKKGSRLLVRVVVVALVLLAIACAILAIIAAENGQFTMDGSIDPSTVPQLAAAFLAGLPGG